MSTGAILLADIIPSFLIKASSPFLPYNSNLRVAISCLSSILSFLVVAFATSRSAVILGVVLTSFASGLGEPTFLAHSTHYHRNVISTWSSGTGGAGVIGALSYSLLREFGLTRQQTLLLMLLVPALELFTFFCLLSKPVIRNFEETNQEQRPLIEDSIDDSIDELNQPPDLPPLNTIREKLSYIPELMVYFIPLSMVYFFEYFINQGLVSRIRPSTA